MALRLSVELPSPTGATSATTAQLKEARDLVPEPEELAELTEMAEASEPDPEPEDLAELMAEPLIR